MPLLSESRFYPRNGKEYPSVTTILSVLSKPLLVPWAAAEERRFIKAALLDVYEHHRGMMIEPEHLWQVVEEATTGLKAAEKKLNESQTIGTGAHALIEWHTRKLLGEQTQMPQVKEESWIAYRSWCIWADAVGFKPLSVEEVVYDDHLEYAGRYDVYGEVFGKRAIIDYKTAKGFYQEQQLQMAAYRFGARKASKETEIGVIVRLPKTELDHGYEMRTLEGMQSDDFVCFEHALELWKWRRAYEKKSKESIDAVVRKE